MRKIILQMMRSLDGLACGPGGEPDWMSFDPAMGKAHYDLAKNADAALCLSKADNVAQKVQSLKQQPGKYILMNGGIRTAHALIKHDLIHEYHLDLCPVALGSGKALVVKHTELDLIHATPYHSGAIGLVYQPNIKS